MLPSFVESYTVAVGRETGCCGLPPLIVVLTITRGQPASEALVLSWLRGEADAVAARLMAGQMMGSTPTLAGDRVIGATFRFAAKW
jgi:hypothetical protein